jgi:hypothetical protein
LMRSLSQGYRLLRRPGREANSGVKKIYTTTGLRRTLYFDVSLLVYHYYNCLGLLKTPSFPLRSSLFGAWPETPFFLTIPHKETLFPGLTVYYIMRPCPKYWPLDGRNPWEGLVTAELRFVAGERALTSSIPLISAVHKQI